MTDAGSSYLNDEPRSEMRACLERSVLAVGLDDATRLQRILTTAEEFQVVTCLAVVRMEEFENGKNAIEFSEALLDAISDILNPAIETARRIARDRDEETESDPRNRLEPARPARSWE